MQSPAGIASSTNTSESIAHSASGQSLEDAHQEFQRQLLDSGLLISTSLRGLYARSGTFEDIVHGLEHALAQHVAPAERTRLRFPSVYPRSEFEGTDYISSFPDLTGTINTFTGGDREHAALLAARSNGEPWDAWLAPTESVLVPAACHPLYPRLTGKTFPESGHVYDILGEIFRHEPSDDPMRQQAFRQYEFVFVGGAAQAVTFRDEILDKLLQLLQQLGLKATKQPANDPFFGRVGRLLARNQLTSELKFEIVVPIYGELGDSTAVASGNYHADHFGAAFQFGTSGYYPAHSSCVGAGLERISLALIRAYGVTTSEWPENVRHTLSLAGPER